MSKIFLMWSSEVEKSGKKSLIISIDDEQIILNSLNTQLQRKFGDKFLYEFAESGEEALEVIDEMTEDGHPLLMVISDQIMPEMNGDELLQLIHQRFPQTIKILLTGQAALESAINAINYCGLYRYVTKPWDEDDFLLTIEQGIDKYFLERELEWERTSLARRVAEQTIELKTANEELKTVLKMREEMANTVVHDMRTPLNIIQGYIDLLVLKKAIHPEYIHYLDELKRQVRRLNEFTHDMLVMAKIESDRPLLNRTEVDIKQLVLNLEKDYQLLARSKNATFVVEIPDEEFQGYIDSSLFSRVLDNLLGNAIKFSPSGSKVTLRLTPAEEPKALRAEVVDEGPGIEEKYRKRIFDKFEVAKIREDIGQIGIGLAFCKMIVEAHGGQIYVEQNEPRGAIFIVEI